MPENRPSKLTVAVVGATGAVGRTMTQVLIEKRFPLTELRLLASAGVVWDLRLPPERVRR